MKKGKRVSFRKKISETNLDAEAMEAAEGQEVASGKAGASGMAAFSTELADVKSQMLEARRQKRSNMAQ